MHANSLGTLPTIHYVVEDTDIPVPEGPKIVEGAFEKAVGVSVIAGAAEGHHELAIKQQKSCSIIYSQPERIVTGRNLE